MKLSQLLLAAALVLQIGCSNPKAASNENFTKAVSAYLMHQEESGAYCIGAKVDHFQEEAPGAGPGETNGAFVKMGFLNIERQYRTRMGFFTMTVYDLTPKGRESFTQGRGFCLGKPELIRVINFTDPGPTGSVSNVMYSYRLSDVPSWATGSDGQAFRSRIPGANGEVQRTDTFVLTGNGWVHHSLAPPVGRI